MLAYIPLWVPAVFLLLLSLGYRQSRHRLVRPAALGGFALLLLAFSAYGVMAAFGTSALPLGFWLAGYALAVFAGARHFAASGMVAEGKAVRLAGSWVPMVLFLAIFTAKFALGFAAGVQSPVMHQLWFIAGMSIALGTFSGIFGARALAVCRFATAARAA